MWVPIRGTEALLTDQALKAWKPGVARRGQAKPQSRIFDKGGARGLFAEISKGGFVRFFFGYSVDGRRRTIRLGSYPALSLSDARQAAMAAAKQLAAGIDPKAAAAADKAQATNRGTVDALLDLYVASLSGRAANEARRNFDKDVLPVIGGMKVADVTSNHIKTILLRFTAGDRDAKRGANVCRMYLHAAWNLALKANYDLEAGGDIPDFGIDRNVVSVIGKYRSAEKVGDRALSWDELTNVWHGVDDTDMCNQYRQALRFLLASGQRVEEVLGMRRSEFVDTDAGPVWVIPATRRKNEIEHAVPLDDWLLSLLPHGDTDLVFTRDGETAPHHIALRQAVSRLCNSAGIDAFTPRDCRRTWKTLTADIGISLENRNRIQGHAFGDIGSRNYDRHTYANEKRKGMDRWCDRLREKLAGRSNVVEFVR